MPAKSPPDRIGSCTLFPRDYLRIEIDLYVRKLDEKLSVPPAGSPGNEMPAFGQSQTQKVVP